MMRNHEDEKKHGPRGEHLRTTANYLRLLIAHGQSINLDEAAAEAVSDKGGATAFVDFDFVTFGRSMISGHLKENPPLWLYDPALDQPSRSRVGKFTNIVLTRQLTTFMGRIARGLDYHGGKLDQHIQQQGVARGYFRLIGCEGDRADWDTFDDLNCDGGVGGGSGGGGAPDMCTQIRASADAAQAVAAVACLPPVAALFPEGCIAATIVAVDLLAVKWAMGCG